MKYILLVSVLLSGFSYADTLTPKPNKGSGNFSLVAPEGLPPGYDGFLYLYPKQGPYKEHRVYLSQGITIPNGEYVLSHRPLSFGGMTVNVPAGKHTQVKVSAVYSSYPLAITHAFQAGEGHGGPTGCAHAWKNDVKKPFLMLFPGENTAGHRRILMAGSSCDDNNPFVETAAKASSLENIDGELATYEFHLPALNPAFPDGQSVEACGRGCVPIREVYGNTVGTPFRFKYWNGSWFSFELNLRLIYEYPEKPGHRVVDFKRLEVEHLLLEDGSRLPGIYHVFQGGHRLASFLKTQTGLDLLPGTYTVETQGKTADGEEYHTSDEITL